MKILKHLSVLLVDDEVLIRQSMKNSLSYFFGKVIVCSNGLEALDILKKEKIDIIFTDYEMPIMNGYELIKEIRSFNKKILITVFSNHDDKEKLIKCIPLGLSGYLIKPIKFEEFKKHMSYLEEEVEKLKLYEFTFGNTHIFNIHNSTLKHKEKEYQLTKLESEFLNIFANLNSQVVNLDMINDNTTDFEATPKKVADLVYRIKSKYDFPYIKNIKDIGYILV